MENFTPYKVACRGRGALRGRVWTLKEALTGLRSEMWFLPECFNIAKPRATIQSGPNSLLRQMMLQTEPGSSLPSSTDTPHTHTCSPPHVLPVLLFILTPGTTFDVSMEQAKVPVPHQTPKRLLVKLLADAIEVTIIWF